MCFVYFSGNPFGVFFLHKCIVLYHAATEKKNPSAFQLCALLEQAVY